MEGEIPRELVLESGMPTSTSCAREALTSRWAFCSLARPVLHFALHKTLFDFGLRASEDLSLCTSQNTRASGFRLRT